MSPVTRAGTQVVELGEAPEEPGAKISRLGRMRKLLEALQSSVAEAEKAVQVSEERDETELE